jgi:two-component system sensor histidine kinase/response regulator
LALLRRFAERQASVAEEIAAALRHGDRETAARLAHTLRGLAGSIGADALAAQAQRVEAAVRAGRDGNSLAPDVERLGAVLAGLIDDLRRALPQPPPPPVSDGSDRRHAGAAARRLATLLADSDVAAIVFLTENSALLRDTLGEHFSQIKAAVEEFDFATALHLLQQAAGDLEIAASILPCPARGAGRMEV